MDDSLLIDVAGLRMHGRPGLGPYVVTEEGVEGWEDGVDMRGERVERKQGPGSFALPGTLDSRTLSIQGVILSDNAREHFVAKNRLTGLLAGGTTGRIQVTQQGHTQWANAMRSTKPKVVPRRGTYRSEFQLHLWCPDPRKYGELNTFRLESGINYGVFHRGNYWAIPKYTIRGSMPGGYTLHLAGTYFTVAQPLVSSAPHTIDFRDGRLYVGGRLTTGGVAAAANLTQVGPGGVPTAGIEPTTTGTAVATMELLDTYI